MYIELVLYVLFKVWGSLAEYISLKIVFSEFICSQSPHSTYEWTAHWPLLRHPLGIYQVIAVLSFSVAYCVSLATIPGEYEVAVLCSLLRMMTGSTGIVCVTSPATSITTLNSNHSYSEQDDLLLHSLNMQLFLSLATAYIN